MVRPGQSKDSTLEELREEDLSVEELRAELVCRDEPGIEMDTVVPYKSVANSKRCIWLLKGENNTQTTRAASIYHGENTFLFQSSIIFTGWTQNNPLYAPLLRRIHVDARKDGRMVGLGASLAKCTGLQHVTIGVDEPAILEAVNHEFRGIVPQFYLPAAAIDRQKNLRVLAQVGMDKLRALRIPSVKFDSFVDDLYFSTDTQAAKSGSIPNGILNSVVAKEMMSKPELLQRKRSLADDDDEGAVQPLDHDDHASKRTPTESDAPGSEQHGQIVPQTEIEATGDQQATFSDSVSNQPFRFLDFLNEVRNHIYEYALTVDGPISPSKAKPSSVYRLETSGPTPPSVLALLQVNKQVHQEAVGIYYSRNEFVFYKSTQLLMFFMSLSEHRKSFIHKVTLWLGIPEANSISVDECAVKGLSTLPHLESLDLIVDELVKTEIENDFGDVGITVQIQC